MLFKKKYRVHSIRRVIEMDLGNFGGHEVFNSFGGQTNHQTFKATCRLLVLRKFVVIIVLINQ